MCILHKTRHSVAWADYQDKLAELVLSGTPPDIAPNEDSVFSQEIRDNMHEMYAVGLNVEATDTWTAIRGKYESAIQSEIDSYNAFLRK